MKYKLSFSTFKKISETNRVYHTDIMIADNNIIQGKNDCVTGSKKQFPSKTKTPIFYLIVTALSSRKQSKKYRTSAVTKWTASSSVRPSTLPKAIAPTMPSKRAGIKTLVKNRLNNEQTNDATEAYSISRAADTWQLLANTTITSRQQQESVSLNKLNSARTGTRHQTATRSAR